MKLIKKIIFIFALAISVVVVREFISLYSDLRNIDEYWGYAFLIFCGIILIAFVIIPSIQVLLMPSVIPPTTDKDKIEHVLNKRLKRLKSNKYLVNVDSNFQGNPEILYNNYISILENKAQEVRHNYISKVFYSTAFSQNGFIDAIIVLSAAINLIKEIFIIYNGRVSVRDLLKIGAKIYTAMAIAGSEGVEYVTDEIFTSLGSDTLKSIPFIDKIMGSITDGFVNAVLVTRISLIAENYCKLIYIENDKKLLPKWDVVLKTVNIIKADILNKLKTKVPFWKRIFS